jgi:hypothetical protein
MELNQPEPQQAQRQTGYADTADVLGEIITDPQGVVDIAGLLGEGLQQGGEYALDGAIAVAEMLGEICSGLFS